MSNFEFNKIFAGILLAGITVWFSAFVVDHLIHPEALEKDAITIEGGEVAAAGPVAVAGPEPILALLASADIAKGEKLSKACAACHSFDKGGANKVGPNLWNVVGAPKASKDGFAYSSALTAHGGDWSYDELNEFLYKPKKFISGTKMNYIGLKKESQRADIVAWLRTLSDSPVALPSASDDIAPSSVSEEGVAEEAPAAEPVAAEEAPAE